MSRLLITTPEFARPAYSSPVPAPVLVTNSVAYDRDEVLPTSAGALVDPDITAYPSALVMYTAGFYGDYYNHIFVIPATLSLIDPAIDAPNKFFFWSTYFDDTDLSSITSDNDLGLTLSFTTGLELKAIKLTQVSIAAGEDTPEAENAHYLFGFTNGGSTRWIVELVKTNLLAVPPETPITEVLHWKTDVIAAQDGTEQRIGAMQFARIVHQATYLFLEDSEHATLYDQMFSKLNGVFSYPIWSDQTRLLEAIDAGALNLQIDTSVFDLQDGDSIYLDNENGISEQVRVSTVSGTTATLSTGTQNAWSTDDHIYRVTQAKLPAKPSYQRSSWAKIDMKVDITFTDFRDLFSADAITQELVQATIFGDRVLTRTIYTLNGIPVLHGRPYVDSDETETFDWNFEVIDFDIGALDQLTNRLNAQVSYDRKFIVKNLNQKFYWNWVLKWMHGQRKPVWLPTWFADFGDTILEITGSTIKVQGQQFLNHYTADSSNRGVWIAYEGGWFARAILTITGDGSGNTIIGLNLDVPSGFPTSPPYDVGFMILARQATDEVQREIRPAYSMITTSFIGTKDSPEAPS